MTKINTRKALSPAYRKHKPYRPDVNIFVEHLKECIETVKLIDDKNESEEHLKDPLKSFFQNTFYKENLINTKDRIDLAIYLGKDVKSNVGVIIEAKKPSNKAEFLTNDNLNKKALHELLLYYLRERVDNKNNNIKHLIATNGYEWYLFKAEDFYNIFYKNKALIAEYESFRDGLKDTTKNELFYNEIAKKYIAEIEIPYVYLDFTKTNFDDLKDNHLNTLYKIFSDVHLLGHSFGNDSNQLNKDFYNELLHIIGLEEVKEKNKKIIQRKSEKERDYASLLENTIFILEERDFLQNIRSIENTSNKAFDAGLELCLTWVNRILFLKLLESQLLTYHKGAKEYNFLNTDFIGGFDDLNDLFFSALAKKTNERHPKFKDRFKYIPYLNSSLFERNELERDSFNISELNDEEMTVCSTTVLKDANGKRFKGKLNTLDYFFQFLSAFDFATDGTEGIEDDKEAKSLINASVLGLIFEKINGYKDGSFYTPAYITMYMCKETIRRAVVQKFKEQVSDQIDTFENLQAYCHHFFKKEDTLRFNDIINSIHICDPAVGSGHFLVSALNELILIKNELGILVDKMGLPLRCDIVIENDELYISDNSGHLFEYNPADTESQRIQETLFHEKQTIIENCLFGVDINPNSVKICRLRLWVELLKNAYYTSKNQLQTLPNIDINIKCGNSLISRFNINDDLKDAFKGKNVKYSFAEYRKAVAEYKDTNDKNRKQEVLEIINEVKNNFKSTLDNKFIDKVQKSEKPYIELKNTLANEEKLWGNKISKAQKDKLKELKANAEKAKSEKEEIVNNAIYHNAFEWRFEFPEVLDEKGSYIGFDVVIGNPPYINFVNLTEIERGYYNKFELYKNKTDLYAFFVGLSGDIKNKNGFVCFIIPHTWISTTSFLPLRKLFLEKLNLSSIVELDFSVFKDAHVKTVIIQTELNNISKIKLLNKDFRLKVEIPKPIILNDEEFKINLTWNPVKHSIFKKIKNGSVNLGDIIHFSRGIKTSNDKRFLSFENNGKDYYKVIRGRNIKAYKIDYNNEFIWYRPDLMKEKAGCLPHTKELFLRPEKIITQRVNSSGQLLATYDNKQFFSLDTTNISSKIKDKSYDLKYIVGVINSKLINWWFNDEFKNPTISGYELHQIPIKRNLKFEINISKIVTQILLAKKENSEADTTILENEIDLMVYKLYELTYDDILIVDPEFCISEEEYNSETVILKEN